MGRTREASDEVPEAAEVACSHRIVVLCAMQALERVRECRLRE